MIGQKLSVFIFVFEFFCLVVFVVYLINQIDCLCVIYLFFDWLEVVGISFFCFGICFNNIFIMFEQCKFYLCKFEEIIVYYLFIFLDVFEVLVEVVLKVCRKKNGNLMFLFFCLWRDLFFKMNKRDGYGKIVCS